jgi:hypothetical protein
MPGEVCGGLSYVLSGEITVTYAIRKAFFGRVRRPQPGRFA